MVKLHKHVEPMIEDTDLTDEDLDLEISAGKPNKKHINS